MICGNRSAFQIDNSFRQGEHAMRQVHANDVVSILDYFKDLKDPRSSTNQKHLLGDLIVLCILAVIAGADGPKAIGQWAQSQEHWLRRYLELPGGIPSHDTLGRLLAALKPAAFQECFGQWIASLRDGDDPADETQQEIVAIDGKALRRSHDRRRSLGPLYLVSAWSTRRGISLGQLATAEKSNEITAIPQLLDQIDIRGTIVTIDAAGCQKNIAAKIRDHGGDYVLALKGNQGNLHRRVDNYVTLHIQNDFANVAAARKYSEVVKGHGRVDTLTYYQLPVPKWLKGQSDWKGLRTLGVAVRVSEQAGKVTRDVRYYLVSLRMGVRRFAAAVRGHWGIENSLHWCLDVTFKEDDSRVRDRYAADNLAWLKRFAITLLKQQNDKESIAMRRRMAGWNHEYLAQVLGISKR
jgi:predicted transposase YbfD/YdcC